MTSSPSATGPASLYSDTSVLSPGDPIPSIPRYPPVLANGHYPDPRRTISSPPLPSARLNSAPGRGAHDTRSPIQRFGHRTVHQSDVSVLKELIALHTAELDSLGGQLREADKLLADAEKRAAHVQREVSQGTLEKGCHDVLSAQAIRESVIQGRQGIQDRIIELKRLRDAHKGLLHPIRRLPMELLMMVMQFAVVQEEFDRRMAIFVPDRHSLSRTRFSPAVRINSIDEASNPNESPSTRHHSTQMLPMPILLSHVCSYWRTTAHKTAALWRNIHFRLTGQPDVGLHSWSLVRWFMEKARHHPTTTETPGHNAGMALVFTGWVEHGHPSANDILQKILRMLADNEGGKPLFDASTEVASHSRRYSDAPSTIELSLTPDSETEDGPGGETVIIPGMPILESLTPEAIRTFRIARLEINFHELCEHETLPGQNRNSQLHWLSKCPKPEEVVFIAHDSVYRTSPHGDAPNMGLLNPPYSKSLIPCAKQVTLCNLSFDWAPTARMDDPYSNLTSLKLIYTCHFDRLLVKPETMENMGFLQFLRVAHNLVDLEIRLPLPTSPSSVAASEAPSTLPAAAATATVHSNGMPPISIPASLQQLVISLPDLCRLIPLFLSDSSRPSAPTIHLSSLHHLSILPHDTQGMLEPVLVARNAELIHEFLQTTEANITHLEFLHPSSSEYPTDLTSSISVTSIVRHPMDPKDQILFLLQHLDSCQTLQVWGDENVKALIAIFGLTKPTNTPSVAVLLGSDMHSDLYASARTSSSSRPAETAAVTKVQPKAQGHPSTSSAPQSTIPDSLPSPLPPITKSPKKLSKPAKRSPSAKPQKRTSLLSTPKEIIARVLSPVYKRKSLAIVETPVGTPKMVIDDLPMEPVPDFKELHSDPARLAPPHSSMRSAGDPRVQSRMASSSRVDAVSALTSGDESSALVSSVSRENYSTGIADSAAVFPSVKKIIVHDGISFVASMAKALTDRKIEVVVCG